MLDFLARQQAAGRWTFTLSLPTPGTGGLRGCLREGAWAGVIFAAIGELYNSDSELMEKYRQASARLAPDERARIAARHGSDDLWHAAAYQQAIEACGFRIERYEDCSEHIAPHFAAVFRRVEEKRAEVAADIDDITIQHNYNIWSYWSQAGREGKIGWGYFIAVKDA